MILIGLGGNLPSLAGAPLATLEAALERLVGGGVNVVARSPWYETAPVPISDQPWFINGVVQVKTAMSATALLALMHQVEADLGRARTVVNAARVVDLDLLAYGDEVRAGPEAPVLPHPRLQDRAFVLLPMRDIAPDWRHPVTKATPAEMIARMPVGQQIRPLKA
jgi:2-amino-4-hydroxy-6-hydroxymethyldihydropteridine diphosphokinase